MNCKAAFLMGVGVKSKLVLLPGEYADSYCMGNSSNPAAKGSPCAYSMTRSTCSDTERGSVQTQRTDAADVVRSKFAAVYILTLVANGVCIALHLV